MHIFCQCKAILLPTMESLMTLSIPAGMLSSHMNFWQFSSRCYLSAAPYFTRICVLHFHATLLVLKGKQIWQRRTRNFCHTWKLSYMEAALEKKNQSLFVTQKRYSELNRKGQHLFSLPALTMSLNKEWWGRPLVGKGACIMATLEHPTHHINWHTYI